jgi:hypothetical protein
MLLYNKYMTKSKTIQFLFQILYKIVFFYTKYQQKNKQNQKK